MRLAAAAFFASYLLLLPAISRAQIDLSWHDCITQPAQATKVVYACDGSRGSVPYRVVMSFRTPVELPKFVGFQADIRILAGVSTLPDFWRLAVGECREGSLRFPTPPESVGTGTTGACQNPWAGAITGGGYLYTSQFGGIANYARIQFAFARMDSIPLHTGQDYVAGVFTLDMDSDAGSCPGCASEGCLELNQIELFQVAGTPPQDIVILNQSIRRRYVDWQGTSYGNCFVPVRNTTWGAVKALYH